MKEILQKIGLTAKEADIYLMLLSIGSATASNLSYRTGIAKTSCRYLCDQLTEKKLISSKKKGNTLIYAAESPEKITYLLEEEERKVQQKKREFDRVIGDLKAMVNPNIILPKLKFFTGKEGFIKFCEESLLCEEKEILFLTSIDHFRNIVTEKYDTERYIPTRLRNKIFLKLLCVRSEISEEMKQNDEKELREIRFLPQEFFIKNTIFIFDNVTTLISNEEFASCIMIYSKEISDTMRAFYKFAWSSAEKQ